MEDDAESIITNQRYAYINKLVTVCVKKGRPKGALSTSDKIDRIVTNKWLALPIFALVMFLVYYISWTTLGTIVTDFTNDVFVTQWIQEPVRAWMEGVGAAGWLTGLMCDGIIAGVGGVLGFVPRNCSSCSSCWPSWRTWVIWPALPSSWTAHLPPVRPVGQELHPHAHRHRLQHCTVMASASLKTTGTGR